MEDYSAIKMDEERSSQTHIHILIFVHLNLVHNKNRISNKKMDEVLKHTIT